MVNRFPEIQRSDPAIHRRSGATARRVAVVHPRHYQRAGSFLSKVMRLTPCVM